MYSTIFSILCYFPFLHNFVYTYNRDKMYLYILHKWCLIHLSNICIWHTCLTGSATSLNNIIFIYNLLDIYYLTDMYFPKFIKVLKWLRNPCLLKNITKGNLECRVSTTYKKYQFTFWNNTSHRKAHEEDSITFEMLF